MCEICRRIESEGVPPVDMLGLEMKVAAISRSGEPVFETEPGRLWTLERHAIHEDVWFLPFEPPVTA